MASRLGKLICCVHPVRHTSAQSQLRHATVSLPHHSRVFFNPSQVLATWCVHSWRLSATHPGGSNALCGNHAPELVCLLFAQASVPVQQPAEWRFGYDVGQFESPYVRAVVCCPSPSSSAAAVLWAVNSQLVESEGWNARGGRLDGVNS